VDEFVQTANGLSALAIPTDVMVLSGKADAWVYEFNNVKPYAGETPAYAPLPDGTKGQVIILQAVCNIPPFIDVDLDGATLVEYKWLAHDKLRLVLNTDAGAAGDTVEIEITDKNDAGNTITYELGDLVPRKLELISELYEIDGVEVGGVYEGETISATLKIAGLQDPSGGAGFPVDLTSYPAAFQVEGDLFSSIVSAELLSDLETIEVTLVVDEELTAPTTDITFTYVNTDDTIEVVKTVLQSTPVISYVTVPDTAAPVQAACVIAGSHFKTGNTLLAYLQTAGVPGTPGAGFAPGTINYVSTTQITFTANAIVGGNNDMGIQVVDASVGGSNVRQAFQSAFDAPNTGPAISTVSVSVGTNAVGQDVTIQVTGQRFDPGARVGVTGGAVEVRNLSVPVGQGAGGATALTFQTTLIAAAALAVTVTNPDVVPSAAVDNSLTINADTTPTPDTVGTDNGLEPKASGTLTISDSGAGGTFLAGVVVTADANILLGATTRVDGDTLEIPYTVPADAVQGATITFTVTNLSGADGTVQEDVEFFGPVIYNIAFSRDFEGETGVDFIINGKNFDTDIDSGDLSLTTGSETTNIAVSSVTANTIVGTLDFTNGSASTTNGITVTNPNSTKDDEVTYVIQTTPPPRVHSALLTPNEAGAVASTLTINGENLYPTATAVLDAAVFDNVSLVSASMTRWIYTVDIIGSAGDPFGWDDGAGAGFSYNGNDYTLMDIGVVGAASVGTPTITSVSPVLISEDQTSVSITITGTNLGAANVDEIRIAPRSGDENYLPFEYTPIGAAQVMVNESIDAQSSTSITCTFDFNVVAPNTGAHGLGTQSPSSTSLDGRVFDVTAYLSASPVATLAAAFRVKADAATPGWYNENTLRGLLNTTGGAINTLTFQFNNLAALPGTGSNDIRGLSSSAPHPTGATIISVNTSTGDCVAQWTNPIAGKEVEIRIKPSGGAFTVNFVVLRFLTTA
jgi:hypothetical protein